MSRIGIISEAGSDISRVLEHSGHDVRLIRPDEVASHDLALVGTVCSRVALIDEGRRD